MPDAPSARIAADLRRRIAAGELAPGDRLPSTRDLTRRWGVAMATATKALAVLRHEGLTRPVPGVGTVVAAPPAPAASAATGVPSRREAPRLDRERIVRDALAIADAEGLAAVSMRRVASQLGVGAMSLYRHVADKDDLHLAMMDAAIRDAELPATAPADVREALEAAALRMWRGFRRHPWLAGAMSLTRPQLLPAGLDHTEWVLAALTAAGLDLQRAMTVHLALVSWVRAVALDLEREADAEAASGLDEEAWTERVQPELAAVLGDAHPHLARVVAEGFDLDLDAVFRTGLRALLDGLFPPPAPAAA